MRKDFFYRLTTGGKTRLDPLRKNKKKITELLHEFESEHGVYITPTLKKYYRSFSWPGNIRQLLGHLRQKLVLSGGAKIDYCSIDDELKFNIIEEEVFDELGEIKPLDEIKKVYVYKVYERLGKNIKKTSRLLCMSPNTVRSIIREKS